MRVRVSPSAPQQSPERGIFLPIILQIQWRIALLISFVAFAADQILSTHISSLHINTDKNNTLLITFFKSAKHYDYNKLKYMFNHA